MRNHVPTVKEYAQCIYYFFLTVHLQNKVLTFSHCKEITRWDSRKKEGRGDPYSIVRDFPFIFYMFFSIFGQQRSTWICFPMPKMAWKVNTFPDI